ncbi:V-type ATP synthase subunit E [bacterium]|nr:V-type ATP synthase subunit E [bacterium]
MSLEKIIERINHEIKKKVEAILDTARKKEKDILAEAHKKAQGKYEQKIKKGKEKGQAVKNNLLAEGRLEQRKAILETKQEQIENIYQSIFNQVLDGPVEKYQNFIKKIILEIMESQDGEIFISSRDADKITPRFIEKVNKELKIKQKGKLKLSGQTVDINGGFILRQGKIEIDNSFNTWNKLIREETLEEVSSRLFNKVDY